MISRDMFLISLIFQIENSPLLRQGLAGKPDGDGGEAGSRGRRIQKRWQ